MTFDDLLAARVVSRLDPTLRSSLLLLLADRRDGALTRGLLATLQDRQILEPAQVQYVRDAMDRYKRGRALGIFQQFLVSEGLERTRLEAETRALGALATVQELRVVLVRRGLLSEERAATAMLKARALFDDDLAQQLEEHLTSTPVQPPPQRNPDRLESGRFAAIAKLPDVGSGIYRLDELVPTPSVEETERLVESSSGSGLAGVVAFSGAPLAEIPPWVDTSVIVKQGIRLVGDYRVLGRIAKGGSASVYLATPLGGRAPVALKVLERGDDPDEIGRFKREALATSLFSHPNVLPVLEVGEDEGAHFLTLPFYEGRSLDRLLEERGRLPAAAAVRAAAELACALDAAHRAHVIHRDVKPSNVLVSDDLAEVRLTDFGIARVERLGGLEGRVFQTQGQRAIGTARYMAPEQVVGGEVGPRADLYALGVLLFELLSGSSPYPGEGPADFLAAHVRSPARPLTEVAPEASAYPPQLQQLLAALLAKDPSERPGSAADVRDALRETLRLLGG